MGVRSQHQAEGEVVDGDDLKREWKNLGFRQLINRGTFTDFYVKEKRVQRIQAGAK